MDDSTSGGNRHDKPDVGGHDETTQAITLADLLAYVAPDASALLGYLKPIDEFQLDQITLRMPDDLPIVDVSTVRVGSRLMGCRLEVYLSDQRRNGSDFVSRLPRRGRHNVLPRGRNDQLPEAQAHNPRGGSCHRIGRGPLDECPDCGPRRPNDDTEQEVGK